MNEKNFDSISQFEVPQNWIDDALAVPQIHTKKPFPFIKFSRTLAAVACLVLVCGISVALYFIVDDSSIPPVKPSIETQRSSADSTYFKDEESKDKESDSEDNDSSSITDMKENEDNTQNGVNSHPEPNEKPQKEDDNKDEKPQKPSNTHPSQEKPKETFIQESIYQPTQAKPTDYNPPEPTMPETIVPETEPSEPYYPPPWVTPTVKPTTPTKPNYDDISIVENFGKNRVEAAINIYCAIYDSNGNLLGDSDLYASSHLTVKGITNGSRVYIHYYVYRMLEIPKSGTYTYVFYNSHGEEMAIGTCNLKADI